MEVRWHPAWSFIAVTTAVLALICILHKMESRRWKAMVDRVQRRFDSRQPTPPDAFSAGGAKDVPAKVVERVRMVLARVAEQSAEPVRLAIPPSVIRPDDLLGEDLAFSMDSWSYNNMVLDLEKEFGIRLQPGDFSFDHFPSAREVTDAVWRKLSSKPFPPDDLA